MLGMKSYPQNYIDARRARVESDIASYRELSSSTPAFEAVFFNNMVLKLEMMFVHRLLTMEGKNGHALNEVRVLAASMLLHDNVMTPSNSIKLSAATSVLGIEYGDEIEVNEAGFAQLSDAFFAELEARFSDRVLIASRG
jgi:hypothetical protein